MTITSAVILIFLLFAILQPGPPKRKRGRRYSYHCRVAQFPASAVPAPKRARVRATVPVVAAVESVYPDRADVISALRNLGWNAKDSAIAFEKAAGTGFDEKLKNALAVMSPR